MTTNEEHRCQNPRCRKPLTGRRSDTLFCSTKCRTQVKSAEKTDEGSAEVWVCNACKHPEHQQADIVMTAKVVRHPLAGRRPEFSGYCVLGDRCGCDKCHPALVEVAA